MRKSFGVCVVAHKFAHFGGGGELGRGGFYWIRLFAKGLIDDVAQFA